MTRRSGAPGGRTGPAAISSRARVTAGIRNRAGISGCGPAVTHTALAPVTCPRWTRHSSPSSTWPSGRRPGWPAAPRGRAGPGGRGAGCVRAEQRSPARCGPQGRRGHRGAARQRTQIRRAGHPAHPDRVGGAARPEAGDDRGGRRVGEHRHGRLDQMDRLAAERAEQQFPDQAAVVHVQPLGRGDEHAHVARGRVPRGGQEEVGVQPGQPARGQPVLPRGPAEPLLPGCGDLVVPHVGRVAQEQRGAAGRGQRGPAVVAEQHRGPAGEPGGGQAGPAEDRGRRVDLHADQGRLRPAAPGGQEHPGRAGAGIHDPGRPDPGARGPGDHARDDRRRGERLAEDPPARRAAQRAEGVPERVFAGPDPVPGRRHRTRDVQAMGVRTAAARTTAARTAGAAGALSAVPRTTGPRTTGPRTTGPRPRAAARATRSCSAADQPATRAAPSRLARSTRAHSSAMGSARTSPGGSPARTSAGYRRGWLAAPRQNAGHPHHCDVARPRARAFPRRGGPSPASPGPARPRPALRSQG